MECFPATKKNKLLIYPTTCMELKCIILCGEKAISKIPAI
jgi:hypothetical protein